MKTILTLLLLCPMLWAQDGCQFMFQNHGCLALATHGVAGGRTLAPVTRPKPLKCGKYQHVFHWPADMCGPSQCEGVMCSLTCPPPPPDKCVDDVHVLTEKEWQSILKRLNKLEFKTSGQPVAIGGAK